MKVRHLKIRNFRGIARLDWSLNTAFVCLIGAGDSGKTTVLDAISYALTPRWSLPITDADFLGANPEAPIEIELTVIDPPPELLPEEPKFGLFVRGWSDTGELHDDPQEGDSLALTIRFTVDRSLEPEWMVVKDAMPEGKPIRSGDRAKLKVFRVDEHSDHHLGWGRGSALAGLTGDLNDLPGTLAAAHRVARSSFTQNSPEALKAAAEAAHARAVDLGVRTPELFQPALAPEATARRSGLVLSSAGVPATGLGLGSRRLTALAVQEAQLSRGAVVIVDEVEHALEPYRLRHLLHRLKTAVKAGREGEDDEPGPAFGQVFLSTHSPLTLQELQAGDLHLVRAKDEGTEITRVPDAFGPQAEVAPQALVKAGSEALLGRRVVVGEGKTEVGVLRALTEHWSKVRGVPLAHLGAVPMDGRGGKLRSRAGQSSSKARGSRAPHGGGGSAPARAIGFARLGYPTALLLDSDEISWQELEPVRQAGVRVVQWSGECAIEERLALDLPPAGFHELVCRAVRRAAGDLGLEPATNAIRDRMANHLPPGTVRLPGLAYNSWLEVEELQSETFRRAFGRAAQKAGWFKDIDGGEALGTLIAKHLPAMEETDTAEKIQALERFAYGED